MCGLFILDQLASDMVESFVVVNYEELIQHQTLVSAELTAYIKGKCRMKNNVGGNPRRRRQQQQQERRLHLYTNETDSFQYLVTDHAVMEFANLTRSKYGPSFMKKTSSILAEFGYQWDPRLPFQMPPRENDSKLLFTSDKPPSNELVQKMKDVSET